MHPEADALLDAIFAEPDEDTPRLVYADWLEEHDQANYAAFIRMQCAAARHTFWTPEANDLWEQIGRVWTRLADEWWEATHWWGPDLDAIDFWRGFPRHPVHVGMSQVIDRSAFWWPPDPFLRLSIDTREDEGGYGILDEPVLFARHLRELTIRHSGWDFPAIDRLLMTPMPRLRALDLFLCHLSDAQLFRVSAPGVLPANCRVRFNSFRRDPKTIVALNQRFGAALQWDLSDNEME